jgi:hypothetical protein
LRIATLNYQNDTYLQYFFLSSAMNFTFLTLASLLLSVPYSSQAQDSQPVPAPKFYVGLAAYSGPYQAFSTTHRYRDNINIPVQATLGYQFRPRLAVQLGLTYSGYKNRFESEYEYTNIDNYKIQYNGNIITAVRTFNTALLMRYTLTRKPAHHFQFDVLGGLTLIHQGVRVTGNETYSYADYPQSPSTIIDRNDSYPYNSLNATLGPEFSYRFRKRLEAVGDILFNLPITGTYRNLYSSVALGLRYHFGQ